MCTFVIICSRRPHNCKTGHFTSWKELERLRNIEKRKMHVQSVQKYGLSMSNMHICDVLLPSLSWLLKLLIVPIGEHI